MTDQARRNTTELYPSEFLPIPQQKKALKSGLIQSADELSKEIHQAADKVRHSREEALKTAKEWRQKQLESIEQHYLSQCNNIEERFDRLMSLERDVRIRLSTEVNEPLVNGNLTDETAVIVQETIDSVRQDVWQLRWNAIAKEPKMVTVKTPVNLPEKHQGFSKLFEQAAKDGNKQGTPWVDGWAKEAKNYTIITPSGLNSKKSKVKSKKNVPPKYLTMQRTIQKAKKLVDLFSREATEAATLAYLKKFLQITLKKEDLVLEQIATVFLSLLIAGSEQNLQLMVMRYEPIVKYCIDQHIKGDFMILVGIQVFIATHDQVNATSVIPDLLRLLIDRQCIRRLTLFNWYEHGTYGKQYIGYELTHQAAFSYINEPSSEP